MPLDAAADFMDPHSMFNALNTTEDAVRMQQPWLWMDQHDLNKDLAFAPPTQGPTQLSSSAAPKQYSTSTTSVAASHPHEINELAQFLGADDFGLGFEGLDTDALFHGGLLL